MDARELALILHETIEKRIAPLRERLDALEARPELKYLGTHKPGQRYERGNLTTCSGSLWHCNDAETLERPGESAAWTLVAKRGSDGRGAPTELAREWSR